MAKMLWSRTAVRMWAIVLALTAGTAAGQTSLRQEHLFRGPATVSVATLKLPDAAWKHFEKAKALAEKHEVSEAAREGEKALAIAPQFVAARVLLASQQLLLKEFGAALSNAAIARRSEADAPWAGLIVAAAYNGMGRYDDALDVIGTLPTSEAGSWQAKYEKARAEIGLGDVENAIRVSEEALDATPKEFGETMLVRANALMLAHRWPEAEECLKDYLAFSGAQPHRAEARAVLQNIAARMRAEHQEPVSLASR